MMLLMSVSTFKTVVIFYVSLFLDVCDVYLYYDNNQTFLTVNLFC